MNTCRGCGRKIHWAITENQKRIPLDAVAPVYEVAEVESAERGSVLVARRAKDSFVSHFATCTKRDEFRKPTAKPTDTEETW